MKIFIAGGAGTLGSCIAQALAADGLADEIVLYDLDNGLAENHAMDLLESVCLTSGTDVHVGSLDDLRDSNIIVPVIAAYKGNDHMKSLEATAPILLDIMKKVEKSAPDSLIITASNPVDIYNYLFYRYTDIPAKQWLGFSFNDTLRFRRNLGIVLGVAPSDIEAYAIGEHGPTKTNIFSSVKVNDAPVTLAADQKKAVLDGMDEWWGKYINNTSDKRTAGWSTAYGIAEMVRCIEGKAKSKIIPCSCVLDGLYGQKDISLAVPARLSRSGVEEIIELPLDAEEQALFDISVAKVRKLTEETIPKYV